jgi:Leucine-rich repeat (LRR) protein
LFANQLKHIDKETFSGLLNLKKISLSCNRLLQIDEQTFNGLVNLKELYLYLNQLQTIGRKYIQWPF